MRTSKRFVKSFLSMLLVLTMLISLLSAGASITAAENNGTASLSTSATRTIYFAPNGYWSSLFAAYAWTDGAYDSGSWYSLKAVSGEEEVYTADISGEYTNIVFCSRSIPAYSWDVVTNKTEELAIPDNYDMLSLSGMTTAYWSLHSSDNDTDPSAPEENTAAISTVYLKPCAEWMDYQDLLAHEFMVHAYSSSDPTGVRVLMTLTEGEYGVYPAVYSASFNKEYSDFEFCRVEVLGTDSYDVWEETDAQTVTEGTNLFTQSDSIGSGVWSFYNAPATTPTEPDSTEDTFTESVPADPSDPSTDPAKTKRIYFTPNETWVMSVTDTVGQISAYAYSDAADSGEWYWMDADENGTYYVDIDAQYDRILFGVSYSADPDGVWTQTADLIVPEDGDHFTQDEEDETTGTWSRMSVSDGKESFSVVFLNWDGTLLKAQTVKYGESAVAPENPERKSDASYTYTFKEWDKDFSNITADTVVTAVYDKTAIDTPVAPATTGKLKIEVTGGTSFTISFSGGAPRPQGTSYNNSKAPLNVPVTVVANTTNGNEFIGWINTSDGKVLSTELNYSFYTSGNDYIKAMFKTSVEGVQMVSFYDDKNNQYVDSQYYASTDAITFPDFTMAPGYDFIKWNMTESEIQAEITAGNDVFVKPVWERQLVYVTITVNGGTISGTEKDGKYLANSGTTVRANTAPAGQKFAYWADGDGNIKSYDTEYVFYPKTDMVLTAVFVGENDMIDYQVLVSVNSFVVADPYGQVNVSWYVPAEEMGVEYVAGGLIAVNANDYNESTFVHGTSDTKVFDKTGNSATKPVSSYTWTGPFTDGTIFYVKAWVQYKDASGTVQTVYSDIYTVDRVND